MRVLAAQEAQGFVPITIAISIESREELNALYQLANHATAVAEHVDSRSESPDVAPEVQTFLLSLYEELSAYHTRYC